MKISRALFVALALPAALAAQQPAATPTAPPANPITTAFRGRTMNLQRNLAQAFDSIPESKFGYRPTPAQLTVGYIAQHLASDNYFFCNNFGPMKATLSAKDTATADSVKAKWPKDTLVAKLKASFAFCESAFAQLDDAKLADQVTMTFNGQSRSVTRAGMVLGHDIDMADHYSQIANYMRLNNMIPPTALPRPGTPRGGGH
jgi:DinB superfamily